MGHFALNVTSVTHQYVPLAIVLSRLPPFEYPERIEGARREVAALLLQYANLDHNRTNQIIYVNSLCDIFSKQL